MKRPELVCPAGTPAMLRAAVDAGADAVYCGFQNATNARNFTGLNFTPEELRSSVAYAHARGAKVLLALNSFASAGRFSLWKEAADHGAGIGVDAFIVADIGVAAYIAHHHPHCRLHLSVQAGASSPEAINFYCREFGIRRAVLPRILTIPEIRQLKAEIPCEIETFVFGNHGLMVEGRCSLTNYAVGISTNMDGACSPASEVRYDRDSSGAVSASLGTHVIDRFAADEQAGYPTICKGRYCTAARPQPFYAFEEPISLNLMEMLPALAAVGVDALKIEGRQRSRAYVGNVVGGFRKAIDAVAAGRAPDLIDLLALTEGQKQTQGAFITKKWR